MDMDMDELLVDRPVVGLGRHAGDANVDGLHNISI